MAAAWCTCTSTYNWCLFLILWLCSSRGSEAGLVKLHLSLDLCKNADFPALCRSVVKGLDNPTTAMELAIKQLMFETKQAMGVARRNKSSVMDVCVEVYDDAYSNLETCLSSLKSRDKGTLNINLSAALTDYVTCEDTMAERGVTSPITRSNELLRQLTSNCLYLSGLLHLH